MNTKILARGVVTEALPNLQFRIEQADKSIVRAYVSGKMKMNRIKVMVGDKVEFVVDTIGENNRIVKRF